MHFVTEAYLASLRPGATDPTAIAEIRMDGDSPAFHIEVVSDLRVGRKPPMSPEGYSPAEAETMRDELMDRFRRLRMAFNIPQPAHLLINCGDLIVGRRNTKEEELCRVQSAYADICLPAFRQLQDADRAQLHKNDSQSHYAAFLTVPGNEDAYGGGGAKRGPWGVPPSAVSEVDAASNYPYYSHFVSSLTGNEMPPANPQSHPVASVFRISPQSPEMAGGLQKAPLAYIAVIGFDSNDIQYHHNLAGDYGQISGEQLQWAQRLVDGLRNGVACSTPLYVIAVTHHNLLPLEDRVVYPPRDIDDDRVVNFKKSVSTDIPEICDPLPRFCVTNHLLAENAIGATSNASGFLRFCQKLRISSILHGNMHQRSVTTLVDMPLVAGEPATELTVMAAPAFTAGRSASGMARISLDLWKGQAEMVFSYDTGLDGNAASPVQVIRPLVSASRVSSGERRLYAKISALVAKALESGPREHKAKVEGFANYVAAVWKEDGYAAVSFPDGTIPYLGTPTRQSRYYLLLLLREVDGRNYEMLLSRHRSQRPSEIAEWDTLLMPAFGSVRQLMEGLHLDVIRQVARQAEDMDRASNAKAFDDAIERIQAGGGNLQDDIWLDKIRQLDTIHKTKISPTYGEITDYEYRLVVLTPFVRDPKSVPSDISDAEREQLSHELAIVEWLKELPSLRPPGAPLDSHRTIPMEAIMSGGVGLRWEPLADDTGDDDRRRPVLPPGLVWFPVRETDETEGPWVVAPSIRARNADVMHWVDRQLTKRRARDGLFPPHIVLGQMAESSGYSLSAGPFPFELPPSSDHSEEELSTSTIEAMKRVEYIADFDLAGGRPYDDPQIHIRRVVIVRRSLRMPSDRVRDVILVFDASGHETSDSLASFLSCPAHADHGLLGVLRPAQRYVLDAGLERATWVNAFLAEQCHHDPWGFVRAKFRGAGEPLALTPPLIEETHPDDWDSDGESFIEFVVCDGNHRIVQNVWNGRQAAAAIGVVGRPVQPYYARPFSPYEWDVTAENVLSVTPDARFRYAPRRVDLDAPELSDEARRMLKSTPPESRFRRYYRDLTFGFGPMGGQGGHYA